MKHTVLFACLSLFVLLSGCGSDKPEEATIGTGPEVAEVENISVAEVATAKDGRPVILIPFSAVFMRGQLEGVHVVGGDGIVSIRWIRTGNVSGENVEVLSGLGEGEKVVAPYDRNVQEGFQVTVKQ